jgi:hypothetical protein
MDRPARQVTFSNGDIVVHRVTHKVYQVQELNQYTIFLSEWPYLDRVVMHWDPMSYTPERDWIHYTDYANEEF